jgi:cobaltochelatase CobT
MTGGPGPGLLGNLVNVIEDVREERGFIANRPGAAYDLDAVTSYYISRGHLEPTDSTTAIIALAMAYGRTVLLDQKAVEPILAKAREMIKSEFGGAFLALAEGILNGYRSMPVDKTGTQASRDMALQLVRLLEDQTDDPQKQATEPSLPDTETENDRTDACTNDDTARPTPTGQDNQPGKQNKEESSSPSQSKPGSQPGIPEGTPKAGTERKNHDPEKIRKMIEDGTDDFGDLSKAAMKELDRMARQTSLEERRLIPLFPPVDRKKPKRPGLVDESRCITTTSRMRARLMGLLQAVKHLPVCYGVSGRKLAVNRLVRMATGDPRIFRKRVESIAVNTAIVVLLDRTGSMQGAKLETARNAAFSLHHALSGISGVAVHSVAFDMDDTEQARPPIKVLCNWNEKPQPECFGITADGATPTPWALWHARVELLARHERRKICLLVTDGRPEGWDGIEADTHAATARLLRDGIEIAAIGIHDQTVCEYWKNIRVIQDLDELPEAMFAVMTGLLTRKHKS